MILEFLYLVQMSAGTPETAVFVPDKAFGMDRYMGNPATIGFGDLRRAFAILAKRALNWVRS